MDINSDTGTASSSSVENDSDSIRLKSSNSELFDISDEHLKSSVPKSQPVEIDSKQHSRRKNSFSLNEDHFSLHSDIDYLNDLEFSVGFTINLLDSKLKISFDSQNLNLDEQLELSILKHRNELNEMNASDIDNKASVEKKRLLVKKICDLKIKLAKYREDLEFNNAMKDTSNLDDLKEKLSEDNPIFFKRIYSFSKSAAGHRLVLSTDIYENEKRLRSIWKNYVKNSSPISFSPPTSPTTDQMTSSLPISRIINLLTSNHLSYLNCVWSSSSLQPTNPMQKLVCDYCSRKSSKSLNDYIIDALKLNKKEELSQSLESLSLNDSRSSMNPFLVCIFCLFTIHYNCLSKTIRKCPKLFFDMAHEEEMEDFYSRLYNFSDYQSIKLYKKKDNLKSDSTSDVELNRAKFSPISGKLNNYQNRMKRIILKICPEIGLSNQDFRCAECRIAISPSAVRSDAKTNSISSSKLCDYSGLYFCENCHLGDTAIIPARVIHNWDFQPQPVSRAALQIISYLKNKSFHYDRPVLINLVEINPMLYGLVDELIQIKRLRTELCHIYKYVWLCKQPSRPRQWISIMCQLGSHLLNEEEINYLSFCDICDLKSLVKNLSELENLFINHIVNCEGCRGKGFYCELCPNKEDILFPFSPNTTICSVCNAVYHKNCYYRRNQTCPRCNRIKSRTNALTSRKALQPRSS
ncbi:DUF4206 domain containing protein [Sarcoptes scabiei]|uniref:DUF4206 domain containing protein n=1 Tax=Sarcoptes scabiei TaxID=52283 RepID=A0A132A296_SARSC|nr:DUF4206 domain containing protein [Sarcoptes scabiei]